MDHDAILARKAAAGDTAAFTILVRGHEGAVRRFLGRLSRQQGSDDLAQETFLRAWRRASDYRGEGTYRGWLMRIAWTVFLDTRRAAGRREEREAAIPAHDVAHDPNQSLDLQRALALLGTRERAAALLCFGEGCSHGEAAEIMGLPLGTLKSILARARAALVERLEN
ncbi:MAG TPA: RNA polymerase sigma factor [Allosphingosinicella sp.]|nr:RNA polymerase sigma factor [Allosphingosinicella sp.]